MPGEKHSISLPREALAFVERYRKTHLMKTRSEVVQEALTLLREHELEGAYREANLETHLDWGRLSKDGLTDQAW